MTSQSKMEKAPWVDYKNNDLFEGDKIIHPNGDIGEIVILRGFTNDDDKWRVNYGTNNFSRLCIQVGDKGQAVKHG